MFRNLSADTAQADDGCSLSEQFVRLRQTLPCMCLLIFPCLDETPAGRKHCPKHMFSHGDAMNAARICQQYIGLGERHVRQKFFNARTIRMDPLEARHFGEILLHVHLRIITQQNIYLGKNVTDFRWTYTSALTMRIALMDEIYLFIAQSYK